MKTQLSLTEGPIPRALLSFALPILLGNFLQSVNGSVNAIWAGKYLGEAAFAGVGHRHRRAFESHRAVVLRIFRHADAIWWSFPVASMTSLAMASAYYRFGGWRSTRMGVADARAAPAASA